MKLREVKHIKIMSPAVLKIALGLVASNSSCEQRVYKTRGIYILFDVNAWTKASNDKWAGTEAACGHDVNDFYVHIQSPFNVNRDLLVKLAAYMIDIYLWKSAEVTKSQERYIISCSSVQDVSDLADESDVHIHLPCHLVNMLCCHVHTAVKCSTQDSHTTRWSDFLISYYNAR